jgi:uncharacterized protein YciI
MMRLLVVAFCLMAAACATAEPITPPAPGAYDRALAARLGADERGMRMYVLVILKTGPRDGEITGAERAAVFEGHFSNMRRLADEGLLVSAGPLSPNEWQYRGIYIFTVTSVEEATPLVATDPAVAAGVFDYEAYPWYASAALLELPAIDARLQPPSE